MKPTIIAEVGSNWTSYEEAKDSITQAKLAGADAVKFQLFSHEELYGSPDPGGIPGWRSMWLEPGKEGIQTSKNSSVAPHAMPRDWIPRLAEKAKAVGIEFMCTAFSPEGYEFINPFVSRHKVASSEATHLRILQTLKKLGKPVILSTGAQSPSDLRYSLQALEGVPVTLLYCEASYPAVWTDLTLMTVLKDNTACDVGFSDHTQSIIEIPRLAGKLGATIIEKHFKLRDMETPDNNHSLNPDQFKIMTQAIRGTYESRPGPTPGEIPMITTHKRRLLATKDIGVGEILKENENFGIYRSLVSEVRALHPFAIDQVNGKTAKVEIKAGSGIGPGSFE